MRPTTVFISVVVPFAIISVLLGGIAQSSLERGESKEVEHVSKSFTIPVEIAAGHTVLVPVQINHSRPYWFILDTGAASSSISSKVAQLLQLPHTGTTYISGAGESTYLVSTTRATLRIGKADPLFDEFLINSLTAIEQGYGRELGGILGYDFFANHVVEIDYDNSAIRIYDPKQYRYSGPGEPFSGVLHGPLPYLQASLQIGGRWIGGQFLLDSGAGEIGVILNRPFAEEHLAELSSSTVLALPGVQATGGEITVLLQRIQSLRVGKFLVAQPLIGRFQTHHGTGSGTDRAGLIGNDFLRRFKVILDYPSDRIILEPTSRLPEEPVFDTSGLVLYGVGPEFKTFQIYRVLPGSPAAESGLLSGDIIKSIDGRASGEFTLDEVHSLFEHENAEHDLEISRGNTKIHTHLKLRKIL